MMDEWEDLQRNGLVENWCNTFLLVFATLGDEQQGRRRAETADLKKNDSSWFFLLFSILEPSSVANIERPNMTLKLR